MKIVEVLLGWGEPVADEVYEPVRVTAKQIVINKWTGWTMHPDGSVSPIDDTRYELRLDRQRLEAGETLARGPWRYSLATGESQ